MNTDDSCSRDYILDLNLYIDSLNISPGDASELKIKIGKTNTALFLNGVKTGYTTIYQHALDNVLGIPSSSVKSAIDDVETNNSTFKVPDSEISVEVDEIGKPWTRITARYFYADESSDNENSSDDENIVENILKE